MIRINLSEKAEAERRLRRLRSSRPRLSQRLYSQAQSVRVFLMRNPEVIRAKADAKARILEAKIGAYERKMQAKAEYKKQKRTVKDETNETRVIIPSLLLIALPMTATIVGIAFHQNWLWPLFLWLTIWTTVRTCTGWRMKTINLFVVASWAILMIPNIIVGITTIMTNFTR